MTGLRRPLIGAMLTFALLILFALQPVVAYVRPAASGVSLTLLLLTTSITSGSLAAGLTRRRWIAALAAGAGATLFSLGAIYPLIALGALRHGSYPWWEESALWVTTFGGSLAALAAAAIGFFAARRTG